MFSSEEIQEMLDKVNDSDLIKNELLNRLNDLCEREYISESDLAAIKDCIEDGLYESFEAYDSDVCEQFISVYEAVLYEYENEF